MNSHSQEYLRLHGELLQTITRLASAAIYEARDDTGTRILRILPQEIREDRFLRTVFLLKGEAENKARDLFLAGTVYVFDEEVPEVVKEFVNAYIRNARTEQAETVFSYPEDDEYDLQEVVPGEHAATLEDLEELQEAISSWPPYR